MLETKEQKQTFVGAAALAIILGLITLTSHPNFLYREPKQLFNANQEVVDARKYLAYLESLKIDPKASQELFQEILTQADIKKEVENELEVNQPLKDPQIETSKLAKSPYTDKQAVVGYLAELSGSALNFNNSAKANAGALFAKEAGSLKQLKESQQKILREIYSLAAPKDAYKLQEAVAKAFSSYGSLIDASLAYAEGKTDKPWPNLYGEYSAINSQFKAASLEVNTLAEKYKIANLPIQPVYVFAPESKKFTLIKEAHALFGIGDVSITIGDIPRIIMDAIKEGLTASFSQFMGAMLNKLIAKIESNYLIANFLYYTDALVAGQYTQDYLQKYVSDQVDRQIIKRFIPQFNCGVSPGDLRPIFQAKAKDYLGFDVKSLRPSDPDYYEKLARVGDFMSNPYGWEEYYEGQAQEAKSEAEKAAERELTSPGLKTPRDTVNSVIAVSVNNIVSASRASLNSLMNLGISNAESFISSFVSQLTQNLVNKFVFRGVSAQGGALGVLKEQRTCLAAAQLQPVLPLELTQYQTPPAPPTPEELLEQECAKYPRGCTVLPAGGNNP
ncbi:MAG: hypothetical protein HYZ51_03765 [Candidatus Doudnabacteria bacterium]|nr:hypothetical protein [Candidatus Doudnabacteria bacterium]